jgi:hypothetical protein
MKDSTYRLYKATIYAVLGPNDDRLQVRPTDYFTEIPVEEEEYLPKYPPFYKGQVITGLSEQDHGKDYADEVWIIATSDFSSGYVLGRANVYGANTSQRYAYSYNYQEVKKYLQGRHALPDDFDYEHVVVRLNVSNPTDPNPDTEVPPPPLIGADELQGGLIELYNFLTGDYVLLNRSGSVFCVMQNQIYIRVGTPNGEDLSKSTFSAITVKADQIELKSNSIFVNGKKVMLGAHGLHVVGTVGMASTWAEGVPLIPMETVTG